MIIITHGLPGSGKSYCANLLANTRVNNFKFVIIKSVSTRDHRSTVFFTLESIDETIPKTRMEKDKSYQKMLDLAKDEIRKGNIPVLDATFHIKYRREWVYKLAKDVNERVIILHCNCNSEEEIREIFKRRAADNSTKDNILNSYEMYKLMKDQNEPISEDEIGNHKVITINKTADLEKVERLI